MWSLDEFQSYLSSEYGYDVWTEKLAKQIRKIVLNSLKSVQDMVDVHADQKKGVQFELFGYDIMVDEYLNCWLIEVNASPAMDYSTAVTERLVKMVAEDTMKVVIDWYYWPANKKWKGSTGNYEMIYRAR